MQERSANGVKNNFFIRLCYGYVEHTLGKNTNDMTTDQVIEEFLKAQGADSAKDFFKSKFKRSNTAISENMKTCTQNEN